MADSIVLICSITGCSEEEARNAMTETDDPVIAIDRIMPPGKIPSGEKYVPKAGSLHIRERTEAEDELSRIRKTMESMDSEIHEKVTSSQSAGLLPDETHNPHEGTALQSNCVQQCLLPSVEEEAETQETENQ